MHGRDHAVRADSGLSGNTNTLVTMGTSQEPQHSNTSGASALTRAAANLRLYDTATHAVVDFTPVHPGEVGIYVCGATVQSSPHIGHIRAAVAFDVVRRWLLRLGYQVTFVRNVTDIDDKILDKAAAAGQQWWARAYRYEREFTEAYDALGVLPPTYEPRATGHMPDMIDLIQRILDNGHGYVVTDEHGNPTGNVYFDVPSWPHYGELTHQKQTADAASADESAAIADRMGPSVDNAGDDKYNPVDPADASPDKHDPRDFALWKAPKPTDPPTARWSTPFGVGRPGWHLECSAMSHRYLGDEFDIHGGGLDLRFPHHENEMAQSRAAGWGFARHWMHSAWVTAKGEKMSKSLGNGLSVPVVLAEHSAWVVRYALGSVQYRSMLEWSDQTLAEAEAAYERVTRFVERAGDAAGGQPSRDEVTAVDADALPAAFTAAMNDDFNVSGAIAAVFTAIREGNTVIEALAGAAGGTVAVPARLAAEWSAPESQTGSTSGDESRGNSGINAAAADAATTSMPVEQGRGLLRRMLVAVRAMLDTLGLDPLADPWVGASAAGDDNGESAEHAALDALITDQLERRAQARKSRDFATADAIRDSLNAAGITIEDTPQGSTWNIRELK